MMLRSTYGAIGSIMLMSVILTPVASAACHNPTEWSGDASDANLVIIGHSPTLPNFDTDQAFDPEMAFSPPYPVEQVRSGRSTKLSEEEPDTLSYWEYDKAGRLRVCRVELWSTPGNGGEDKIYQQQQAVTRAYTMNAPRIVQVIKNRRIISAILIDYDSQGRIQRVSERDFDSPGFPIVDIGCRRYNDKHQLIFAIQPKVTRKCPENAPDPRDFWYEYRYGGPDKYGVPERLLAKVHYGQADGQWTEKWHPFSIGASFKEPWGNADVSSDKGVTLIWGAEIGHLDNNSANTVLNSLGQSMGMNYAFTKPPVPVDVLQKVDALYRYERRRYTLLADGVRMYELFAANSHFSRHRYYLLDGLLVRHEQLNADGTAKRIITLQNYSQPHPGSKPIIDDRKLSRKGKLLHRVFHRVYEFDHSGNPKLVAMSWNRRKRFTQYGDVPVEYADLAYGTPEGTERWKSRAEFEKAFDTSSRASHVFPDLVHEYSSRGP